MDVTPPYGPPECGCRAPGHSPRLVAITGGPGAGKTAVLEAAQRELCRHVIVLPEAASILWRGQFPRRATRPARLGAQRAIGHIQQQLERIAIEEREAAVVLCDRGVLDGLAYWLGSEDELLDELRTSRAAELARYAAVIHLRTPPRATGYEQLSNPLRVEDAAAAALIDDKLLKVWEGHPNRAVIDSSQHFLDKLAAAIARIRIEIPACCRAKSCE